MFCWPEGGRILVLGNVMETSATVTTDIFDILRDPYKSCSSVDFKAQSFVDLGTLPETNIVLQIHHPKRKLVFQPSIFRRYVSFREGIL